MEDRGGYGVVGGGVSIVRVPGIEVPPGDQAAGSNPELKVKRMADHAFLDCEAGQQARCVFCFSWWYLAHDSNHSMREMRRIILGSVSV